MAVTLYLAGRLGEGEGTLAQFAAELEARGHTVLEKWWELGALPKPYLAHPETSTPAAEAMVAAAADCEVYILFPAENILGAAVELGAALQSTRTEPGKLAYLVAEGSFRQSVFFVHPNLTVVESLDVIRAQEWF